MRNIFKDSSIIKIQTIASASLADKSEGNDLNRFQVMHDGKSNGLTFALIGKNR